MNHFAALTDTALSPCPALSAQGLVPSGKRTLENVTSSTFQARNDSHPQDRNALLDNAESEQTLIYAAKRHGEQSFAKLVARYESAVAGILWHFTRDRLVLEELVQDTFVEAYFSLNRFHEDAPFFPWLRTIATRVGYRHWRLLKRERLRTELRENQLPKKMGSQVPSDVAEYIYRTLEQLGPKDRLVLTLQYFEGCSVAEIAERMGWSQTLVKVQAYRARNRLRALLNVEELS